jgi:PIN domain nuclease of toxin-antitoxin system
MRLLLDTHALLWWATSHASLSSNAKAAIADESSDVYVSAASAWEIAIKVRLGKLEWPERAGSVQSYALGQGFRALAISLEHAQHAGQLRMLHRDPFDRMLIAQAQAEDLLLVSNEALFDATGVRRHW